MTADVCDVAEMRQWIDRGRAEALRLHDNLGLLRLPVVRRLRMLRRNGVDAV